MSSANRLDLSKPRWDSRTYWGRFRHFWETCHPFNIFYSDAQLERAKDIVTRYKRGENIPNISEDELWKQKYIYDSAFHPDSGEKIFVLGRMAAQAPMNTFICANMLTFYKDILKSYAAATSSAVITAVGINAAAKKASPFVQRLVPFSVVTACNAVNLPFSRMNEITNGMKIMDEKGETLGYSKITAKIGIAQVVISRVAMALPTLVAVPVVMNRLEKSGFLKRYPKFPLPFQLVACGVLVTIATPMGCALFPQIASIPTTWIESDLQEKLRGMRNPPKYIYYNKGL